MTRFGKLGLIVGAWALVLPGCHEDDPAPTDIGAPSDADDTAGGDDAGADATGGDTDAPGPASLRCEVRISEDAGEASKPFGPPSALAFFDENEPTEYRASPGFQVDFSALTENVPNGTAVRLVVDGTRRDTITLSAPTGEDGVAAFANVTLLAAQSVTIELTVGQDTLACEPTSIAVESARCDVSLTPAAGCVAGDVSPDPGTQLEFTVENPDKRCDRAQLFFRAGGVETVLESVALDADGKATFTITVDPAAADGVPFEVRGAVASSGVASRVAETGWQPYTADSVGPTVSVDSPATDSLITASLDEDGDLGNGLQLPVTGTIDGAGALGGEITVSDSVTGQSVLATVSGAAPPFAWKAVLTFSTPVLDTVISASAGDACGNVGAAEIAGVDVILGDAQPGLTIATPTDGAVLLAVGDADPGTALTYETTFVVEVIGGTPGATVLVECRDATDAGAIWFPAGSATVIAENGALPVDVSLPADTTTSLECRALDNSPAPVISVPVVVTVALPAPRLIVVLPVDGTRTADPQVAVSAAAENLDGLACTVSVAGDAFAATYPTPAVSAGQLDVAVLLTTTGDALGQALPDGSYAISLACVDTFGNDACATAGADCTVALVLDRTAPTLTITAPANAVLDPLVDADADPAQPGYQADVTVTVDDLPAGAAGTTVCLTIGVADLGCLVVADGATTVTWAAATLQPGLNTLSANATDAAGNTAQPTTRDVTLDVDAVAVVVTRPAQDTSTISALQTLDVALTTPEGAPITSGATFAVDLDGAGLNPVGFAHNGGGVWTSDPIDLGALGVHVVTVRATVAGLTDGFAVRTITLKNTPTVSITEPSVAVVNLATPDCAALPGDCVYDQVVAAGADVDDGSAAVLSVDCGTGIGTYSAVAAGGVVAFEAVTLVNNTTCALSVEVADVGTGLVANAGLSVTVDRSAPVLGPFTNPSTDVVDQYTTGWALSGAALTGAPAVLVGGLEAGQTVTLSTPAGVNSVVLATSVADGATDEVVFAAEDFVDGFVTISATATDAAGNTATAERTFRVDVLPGPATLSFDSPSASSVLTGDSDTDPSTGTVWEGTFRIGVSRGTVGATVTLACRDSGDTGAPFVPAGNVVLTAADGQFDIAATIQVTAQKTKQCQLTDNAAKPAAATTSTFTFLIPAPTFNFVGPAEGSSTNATAVIVTAVATQLDGRTGTFTVTGPTAAGVLTTTGIVGGALADTVHLTDTFSASGAALPDGVYTIVFAGTDALGNDACAGATSDCTVTVILDRTAPTGTITEPSVTTLTPPGDADASTVIPGYQRDVVVTVADGGLEAGAEVCLSLGASALGCATVAVGATTVTFPAVTLQPGANALSATITDAAGNAGADATLVVTVVSDAPQVAILVPASDTSTASATLNVTVEVRNNLGVLQDAGVAAAVFVDGLDSGATAAPLGNGQYQFTVTFTTFGVHTLQATATVNAGIEGTSSPRSVNYKQNAPGLAVSTPPDGSAVNIASAICGPTPGNCDAIVTCAGSDLDDGSAASATATCGAAVSTANTTVSGGNAVFTGLTLLDGSNCTIACTATDLGTGQVATASPAVVTVDRTAPVIANYIAPASNSLIFVDDTSSNPGFQYVVRGRVGGVEAGQVVTLTAESSAGTVTREVTLAVGVPDDQLQIVAFDEMDLAQGLVTFTMTVSDAAGNPATPMVKAVQVVSENPLIRISTPTYVAPTPCAVEADCPGAGQCLDTPSGKRCAIAWNSTSSTTLLLRSLNIATLTPNQFRVCSDNAAYGANAACTASGAGFHEVQVFDVTLPDATLNIAANLIDGVHTLVGEAKLDDAGANWVSTTTASVVADQTRLVVVDRTLPTTAPVTIPTNGNPLACLSASEAAAGEFTLTTTCSEDGTARILAGGVQVGAQAAVAGVQASFAVSLGDGSVDLQAVCVDKAGNSAASSELPISVDTAIPTLAFTTPATSPVLSGASRDVTLTSDEINGVVTLSDNSVEVAQKAVGAGGTVLFDHATFGVLTDGTHSLGAAIADACGNSRAATHGPIVVDTAVPTVAITSPAVGATLADSDDAAAAAGFQVSLGFGTTGDAATATVALETDCASDFTGCNAAVVLSSSAVTNPGGAEPAFVFTLPVFKSPDFVRVTVTVEDAAGNSVSATRTFSVALANCSVSLSGIPANGKVGNALCAVAGTNCASVTASLVGTLVGACGGVGSMTLSVNGSVVDTQPVVGSAATFSQVLTHGSTPTLTVNGVGGSAPSSGDLAVTVDLSDPVPVFTATTLGGFATPGSGDSLTWNVAADLGAAAGMQANVRIDVTDDGVGGGAFSSLTANGAPVTGSPTSFPIAVTGTSFGVDVLGATFADGAAVSVVLTAEDGVGNTATTSFTYTADTVRPAPIALTLSSHNRRRPAVGLSWTAVGDDGGSGTATAYEVRYALASISDGTFDAACDAADLLKTAAVPTPGAAGSAETFTVTGPDARNPTDACKFMTRSDAGTWHFAVRAVDDLGNVGLISSTVSTADLSLRYAKGGVAKVTSTLCTASTAACDADFDARISAIGDVNNDGLDDFAVGGNTSFGFCIHYGQAAVTSDFRVPGDLAVSQSTATNTAGGPLWQCVLDKVAGALNEQKMGHYAQNAGDVNGDGLQDIAVPAYPGSPSKPEVRIFYGTNGGFIANTANVVIKGFHDAETSSTTRWAAGGDFNGDGLGDFVLGASKGNAAGTTDDNRAFVVPGAAWTSGTVINLTVAGDITTHKVQTFSMPFSGTNSPNFGFQVGFAGNVLNETVGPQMDEIIVFAASASPAPAANTKAVVIRGRATGAAAAFVVPYDTPAVADTTLVYVKPDQPSQANFGLNPNILGRDLTGDGIPDLAISHTQATNPTSKMLYVFNGAAVRAAAGGQILMGVPVNPDNSINQSPIGDRIYVSPNGSGWIWVGKYEFFFAAGNVADDPATFRPSAIAYRNTDAAGQVHVRFNHNDTTLGFPYGTYPWADLVFSNPYADSPIASRDQQGVGDVNGDGYDDFVASTDNGGYVVLVY